MRARSFRRLGLYLLLLPGLAAEDLARAQDETGSIPPPFVSQVERSVKLTRNAAVEEVVLQQPLLEGDRLAASEGRFAIQWPDGVVVAANDRSTLDVVDARTLRLMEGEVLVFAPTSIDSVPLQILTRNSALAVSHAGRYLLRTSGASDRWQDATLLDVEEGSATLMSEGGELPVGAGQQAAVQGTTVPAFVAIDEREDPAFRAWAMGAAADVTAGSQSASSYLPDDLRSFAPTLERHGSWDYDSTAGYVWYPQVAVGWQPYSVGVWVQAGRYGWYWAGGDPWAWPTHHYGRWGIGKHGQWYWRPDRRWAPAWVWWAVGPGYVSWCPLDWRGRAIVAPPFGQRSAVSQRRSGFDPWRGWTTVPSRTFGGRVPVQRAAIDARRLPPEDLGAFVTQPAAPPRVRGGVAMRRPDSLARDPRTPARGSVQQALRPEPQTPLNAAGSISGFARRPQSAPGGFRSNPGFAQDRMFSPPGARYPGIINEPRERTLSPYDRATPFLNPQWISPPMSSPGGIPRVREPGPYGDGAGNRAGSFQDRFRPAARQEAGGSDAAGRQGASQRQGRRR